MGLGKFFGKVKRSVIPLAAAATISASAQACREPQGYEIRAPADGITMESERQERVELAADMDTPVTAGNPVFLGLVNDDEVAMSKRMKERGLRWKGLGDLHVHTSRDYDGLKKRYEYCAYGREMPGEFGAFFCTQNDTIYLVQSTFQSLVNIYFHERGHPMNDRLDWNDHAVEVPAESVRIYSSILRRSQDRAVGTMLGRFAFTDNIPQEVEVNGINDISRYSVGVMMFFMEANNQGGDLDKALHSLIGAGRGKIVSIFSQGLERNAGFNAREVLFNEIEDLLNSEGFMQYMETLNLEKNDSRTEAKELVDYFRVMAKDALIGHKSVFQEDIANDVGERNRMLEDYLEEGISAKFFNPNFKNRTIGELTRLYNNKIFEAFNDRQNHSIEEVVSLADKIIGINSGYPCKHDPFACSKTYSNHRNEHLEAYLSKMYAHLLLEQQEGVSQAADAFLETFYPNGDFAYSHNDPLLGAKLIRVLQRAYSYNLTFAYRAKSIGNIAEYTQLKCKALGYLQKLDEATCYRVEDEAQRNQCYNDSGIGATETNNIVELEITESDLEGICQ